GSPNLSRWRRIVSTLKNPKDTVRIAMVGKYVELTDSYKSLNEALVHGGIANECRVEVTHVDSEKIEQDGLPDAVLGADGILVPMGFGPRGTEGKIVAVRHAREKKVPFFGICFGMQMAVIEYARHVCGLERANSTEVDPKTPYPVIDLLPEQRGLTKKGGTMRLGAYPCVVAEGTLARKLYKKGKISERHRHRYEFNDAYREQLEAAGLVCSGVSPDGGLVEMIELKAHPWFLATQFHPEFKSRPTDCHPLFKGFIRAALQQRAVRREAPLLGGLKVVKREWTPALRESEPSRSAAARRSRSSPAPVSSSRATRRCATPSDFAAWPRTRRFRSSTSRRSTRRTAPRCRRSAAWAWRRACASSPRCGARPGCRCSPTCTSATRSRTSRRWS